MSSTSVRSAVGVRASSGAIRSPGIVELPLRARPARVAVTGGESRPLGVVAGTETMMSPGRLDALRSGGSSDGDGARNDASGRRRASGSRSRGGAGLTGGARTAGCGDGRASGVAVRGGTATGGIDSPRPRDPFEATLAIECVRNGRPSFDSAGDGERSGGDAMGGTGARLGGARGEGGRGGRTIGTGSGMDGGGASRDMGAPIAPRIEPPTGGRTARTGCG